ncbi:hypothetical protein [Tychonema sp. BBK16]|uniref:hypothetical protein n=1 Tax=Tychonema sp. BBK16 TaxID=2699888 RepID=UPI001F3CC609|nr:hypothetical protein [Tychonema sp. BBK16]MCF6372216.1 hypothetical protein [Tychonema sp. BBK16]
MLTSNLEENLKVDFCDNNIPTNTQPQEAVLPDRTHPKQIPQRLSIQYQLGPAQHLAPIYVFGLNPEFYAKSGVLLQIFTLAH